VGFVRAAGSSNANGTAGVPGLGFDFPHLAAIGGRLGNGSSSSFNHAGHRDQGFFIPILFGGYPYYPYYVDPAYEQPSQPPDQFPDQSYQQQTEQQPGLQNTVSEASRDQNYSAAEPAPEEAPVPDIGNFVLVRRDGRIMFASLFTVVGTQLRYITPEGTRRTLDMSDLDVEATEQMNEARGSTIQLHR
jgi:hypothetical protein